MKAALAVWFTMLFEILTRIRNYFNNPFVSLKETIRKTLYLRFSYAQSKGAYWCRLLAYKGNQIEYLKRRLRSSAAPSYW